MSRESLLDEAIVKAKEAEDWQLAEWLRRARGADKAARWYAEKIQELRGENMLLAINNRGLKACYDNLSEQYKGLEAENAKLREQVTRLQSDWESERDYADQMEVKEKKAVDENTKLRELAKSAWILFLKHGAVSSYGLPEVYRVRESLNELGIKVSWEELGIEVGE